MRLLLDTHALLWWFDGNRRLSAKVRRLIEDEQTEVLVSAASAWEISTKSRIGKLRIAEAISQRLPETVASQGFTPLPISLTDAQRAGWLATEHRDPFDRMLAAQAQAHDVPIATNDPAFASLGVKVVW